MDTSNIKFPQSLGRGVIIVVVIFFLVIFLSPFKIIGAGQRGVTMHFGKVESQTLDEGIHFFIPLYTTIKVIDVKIQKDDVFTEAASKDLQQVKTDIVVNWHINPESASQIVDQIGDQDQVFQNIVSPAVAEIVKAATAQMNASDIITLRPILKESIDKGLKARLNTYSVTLNDVSIVNISFSDEFNKAIEQKQVAQQQAEQAQYLAQKSKNEADAAINKAQGEAEAQRLLQQSLNADLLQKLWIEKWDGHLPQYTGTGSPTPFFNLNK